MKRFFQNQKQIYSCIDYIENVNLHVTLSDLRDIFVSQFNFPEISITTLWNYFDGELITVKLMSQYNQMRNSSFNSIRRQNYANMHKGRTFFFVDETVFNLNITRRVADAERGTKNYN